MIEPKASTSIPLPSADLINYRFDATDKKFEEMNGKLDAILTQNAHFVSEDRVEKIVSEKMAPIKSTVDTYRWYLRAIVVAVVTGGAYWLIAVLIHKG